MPIDEQVFEESLFISHLGWVIYQSSRASINFKAIYTLDIRLILSSVNLNSCITKIKF
jgi:hypothetical protein